jgi:hypothetical protein
MRLLLLQIVHFLNLFFRFDVGSKNAILLHHIEIGKLFGVDFEKIKSIARAETTVAEIHSSTMMLPPLHLLYTRYEFASLSPLSLSSLLVPLSSPCSSLPILTRVYFFSFSNEHLHTHRVMVTALAVLAGSSASTIPRYFQSQVKVVGKK